MTEENLNEEVLMPARQQFLANDLGHSTIGVWDLETSSLNASFGRVITGTVGIWRPGNVKRKKRPLEWHIFRFDRCQDMVSRGEPWEDQDICSQIRDCLNECDYTLGYNSLRFDLPMLYSRLIRYRQPSCRAELRHMDLYQEARNRFRIGRRTLYSVLQHMHTKDHKTPLDPEVWVKATMGHTKSLDYIVEHNIHDVSTLWELFQNLIEVHPIRYYYKR